MRLYENGTGRAAVIGRPPEGVAPEPGGMRPCEDGLRGLGCDALRRAAASEAAFASIDELGYLETNCAAFEDAVDALLEQKRVIAAVRRQDVPFLTRLLRREDAFVVDLDAPCPTVGCVILASGRASRYGRNKLLEPLGDGRVVEHVLTATAQLPFLRRVLVTRSPEVAQISERAGVCAVLHDLPNKNDSIRLGLEALLSGEDALAACLFCQADQPLMTKESLEALCLAGINRPARLCFGARVGSPAVFPREDFDALLRLPVDKGGAFLLSQNPRRVAAVPARAEWELEDIDCPEDLERLAAVKKAECR